LGAFGHTLSLRFDNFFKYDLPICFRSCRCSFSRDPAMASNLQNPSAEFGNTGRILFRMRIALRTSIHSLDCIATPKTRRSFPSHPCIIFWNSPNDRSEPSRLRPNPARAASVAYTPPSWHQRVSVERVCFKNTPRHTASRSVTQKTVTVI